jgi:hypothetical protein
MDEAEVTWSESGWHVDIGGTRVPVAELVKAWARREETKRLHAQLNELIDARDEAVKERDDAIRDRDDQRAARDMWHGEYKAMRMARTPDEPHKRLWLVERTDAAGKPGEYGNVVVWAHDACDAIDVVMWSGWNGKPMYGYRDRDHTVAVPLSSKYGQCGADAVVVAETLR